ncbi:hybrid sensor histidine kinase/response regulator [Iningainema tapete]|uniref:histidine kinase n=1 Tax=Iningainema tapete BLCC-T55 TaxID=2748662 RepID=A0A8J7C5G8_9CYAN|nr:hybrid sensor histidine kinase/response regulator [Iningainema tapete]MBD2770806.1 hybrid sensor histidine kinase/response regulator [Iningainema tapete BLCC-T55]
MMDVSSIREQGYIYFLSEAPELLQIIEQELFSLPTDFSTAKVHNLMRATHTIKGGAANVGLEVINKVAHSLEDVFNALYNPEVQIDTELQTLLLQAYECLSLPLTAELTESSINDEEILQRAASVFAQLQEKLGGALNSEAHIPTSEELGFDIVLSIFETGITQRIESIVEAINNVQEPAELADFLRSQAEVFLGLAESLNLSGFRKIAQTIIAALNAYPSQVLKIAELALSDLQQAQIAVLAGDRTSGGEPNSAWQEFTTVNIPPTPRSWEGTPADDRGEIYELYEFLINVGNDKNQRLKPTVAGFYLKVIRCIFGWFNHYKEISYSELCLALLDNLDWLSEFFEFVQDKGDSQSLCLYRQGVILKILLAVAKFQQQQKPGLCEKPGFSNIQLLETKITYLAQEYKKYPPVTEQEKNWLDSHQLQKLLEIKAIPFQSDDNLVETIWGEDIVQLTHNEFIPNEFGEAETKSLAVSQQGGITDIVVPDYENKLNIQVEDKSQHSTVKNSHQRSFVRVDVEGLEVLNYLAGELLIYEKQQTVQDEQLQEIIEQLFQQIRRQQNTLNKLCELPLQIQDFVSQRGQKVVSVDFDSLEMDEYTEFHLTLHSAMEESLQLQETTESLDLLLKQSAQNHDKKQRLATDILDNLVEARMLPLGNILNRFTQMVHNFGNMYGKHVDIKLNGTEVLVDKAIAEKLYDPLLHLVRNAFDHGIERTEVRRELGKAEQGLIEICAYHRGSQTVIEVRDDGQGLNLDKIYKKAVELGFIPDDNTTPTQDQLLECLFAPGFSTAGKVSEISGRGIGLDIVRSQLQALNGSITVQSFPNQGTSFVLKIPFSMTTDQLMLVQAGGIVYALLLNSIEKILLPSAAIKELDGKKVLHWNIGNDERMIGIRQLKQLMHYNHKLSGATLQNQSTTHDTGAMTNPVLVLRSNQELLALEVDQIIGEQELVIRPLSQTITAPKYVYGCSNLANGTLILVIDSTLLFDNSEMQAVIDTIPLPIIGDKKKALPMSSSVPSTPLIAPTAVNDVNNNTSKMVLVVDDAMSLRQTLSLTLQKSGYQVLQAQNGVEALEQLQRHPEVRVVISDLEMPRMNGFELLSNVRKNPDLAEKPVVILTSRSAEKHRQLAQALGATAYLTKPYQEQEFLSTVENLINRGIADLTHIVIAN